MSSICMKYFLSVGLVGTEEGQMECGEEDGVWVTTSAAVTGTLMVLLLLLVNDYTRRRNISML